MSNEYSAPSQYAPTYVQLERAYQEVKQQRAELLEASKTALAEAESWISDQLEGTQSYKSAMAKLDPVRKAITKAEAAE